MLDYFSVQCTLYFSAGPTLECTGEFQLVCKYKIANIAYSYEGLTELLDFSIWSKFQYLIYSSN